MLGVLKSTLQLSDKDILAVEALNDLEEAGVGNALFMEEAAPGFPEHVITNIFTQPNIFGFTGILITDDFALSQTLLNVHSAKKKFLYLYHLDWPYMTDLAISHLTRVLLNPNLELIVRSQEHYDLVKNLFKEPAYILPEWDSAKLIEIYNENI